MKVDPYLNFEGRCEEALEFYKKAVGAKVEMMMRCKEAPDPGQIKPGLEDKILHSSFKVGDSTIMATDGYNQNKTNFAGISLALSAKNESEAKRLFDALADGGQVKMQLTKTFFSPAFGMLADKFGVPWMVVARDPQRA
jgi:PhnB protein